RRQAAADRELRRLRPARADGRARRALRGSAGRARRRRPRGPAGQQVHDRRPRLLTGARPRGRGGRGASAWCRGHRDLRGVPDAGADDPGPGAFRVAHRRGDGARPAAARDRLRAGEGGRARPGAARGARRAVRRGARRGGGRVRDPRRQKRGRDGGADPGGRARRAGGGPAGRSDDGRRRGVRHVPTWPVRERCRAARVSGLAQGAARTAERLVGRGRGTRPARRLGRRARRGARRPAAARPVRGARAVSGRVTLVLGGARSGKSSYAERRAAESGLPVVYVATATAGDGEMAARIAAHRARRPAAWRTVEAPRDLAATIAEHAKPGVLLLVECLSLWVSNELLRREAGADVEAELVGAIQRALAAARAAGAHLLLVSNEVGMGVVPPYPLGRRYRDALGRVNQAAAAGADDVYLMVAGIPVDVRALSAEVSSRASRSA